MDYGISDEEFEQLVADSLDAINEEFGQHIDNIVVMVQDRPTPEQRMKLKLRPHTYLFGLYEGVPKTKRGTYTMALPDKITIFKYDILSFARNREHLEQLVNNTVWHEVGHHFGLSDAQIHEIERKKSKQ